MRFSFSLLFLTAALSLAACAAGPGQQTGPSIPRSFLGQWGPKNGWPGLNIRPDGHIQEILCVEGSRDCEKTKPRNLLDYKVVRTVSSSNAFVLVRTHKSPHPDIKNESNDEYEYWHLVFEPEDRKNRIFWESLNRYSCSSPKADERTWANFSASESWKAIFAYLNTYYPENIETDGCNDFGRVTYFRNVSLD